VFQQISSLQDVVDWGLCIGCGACAYACDKGAVTLENVESAGIRPRFTSDGCGGCTKCLAICPGYSLDGNSLPLPVETHADREFGPALEVWEGYAQDPDVRYQASSGGLLSALALYCLEQAKMQFVLHTGVDEEKPWINKTIKSTTKAEILSRTGSRYAPSSPCDGLQDIANAGGECVFIGKPCDAAAVSELRKERPELDRNLGLVLTFFCAGTPSTKGTLDLVASMKVQRSQIDAVRYRGEGWPGKFKVQYDGRSKEQSLSYEESWGKLTGYRPLRCNLCPDGLGRFGDLSCGDAWEKHTGNGDQGRSLVLVRTERGREILHRAIAAGYVQLERVDSGAVFAAQPNLLRRRRELYGRFLAMRLLGVPTPRFKGFSLFRGWLRQSPAMQARTVIGTMRRIVQRKWWKRRTIEFAGTR
jgi:coenzyme F420 hydrogenase subunit beta